MQSRGSRSPQSLSLRSPQPGLAAQSCALAGELRSAGEKGHKQLLGAVLPRLAQYEALPPTLVPQLIQLSSATEDRFGPNSDLSDREGREEDLHVTGLLV